MTTYNRPMALAVGALLFAMAAPDAMASGSEKRSLTSRSGGFLTESAHHAPSAAGGKLAAGLPHLRLDITLTEMENVVIAGSGVVGYAYPRASVKIMSNAADSSSPAAAGPALEFPAPSSGHVWQLANNPTFAASVNPLFVGVIENGCLGAPAMFDLTLDSTIELPNHGEVVGQVHLADTVFGPGHYNLEYTVRATDADGNVSDINFKGHAESYCTGQQLDNVVAPNWAEIVGSTASFGTTREDTAADSITCRPGNSNWCANGFQIQCERQDGGLSTEPDGGVTCTYPEAESESDTFELKAEPNIVPLLPLGLRDASPSQTAGWVSLTCHGPSCEAFAARCDANGGGMSTEPDGGLTCTRQDTTCSGCD